ncbi:MAG: rab guanine nucleotide exchange factor S2 [Piccolia ochrophora]|nr:MAG: rab guanine nucleotide exchange factor S2 [Piccolia ochrophora]
MAATIVTPSAPGRFGVHPDSEFVGTLPDPRSRSSTPSTNGNEFTSPSHHPELNNEVAALSNKLISAINHQTNLDDSLNAARHDLDAALRYIRRLEAEAREHSELLNNGHLIAKADIEDELRQLKESSAIERNQSAQSEMDKKRMEQELEGLTTALFEEANQASARQERDSFERRNEQLKGQLSDSQTLLVSQQEQLAELKAVMQQMSTDREEMESNANLSTSPSTPGLGNQEHLGRSVEALYLSPDVSGSADLAPLCPTSFSSLLQPVLRNDLPAFDDFSSLLKMSRKTSPKSRVSSATYGGLNMIGQSHSSNSPQPSTLLNWEANGSSSSISTINTVASSPVTPSTPASTVSNASSRDVQCSLSPLKETRFYKRALAEDIEPTLRLDAAPGLSWLARRTVLNSMSEGSLIVEPMPATGKHFVFSCSLCGENRREEEHSRKHRFRTSENENAQRYPLCGYCLGRVRATCDFLGFLRTVKDGHWRTDGEGAEKSAWEETVRLRERMFWARIGGGVIPTFAPPPDSRRSSTTEDKRMRELKGASHKEEGETEEPGANTGESGVHQNTCSPDMQGLAIENIGDLHDSNSSATDVPSKKFSNELSTDHNHESTSHNPTELDRDSPLDPRVDSHILSETLGSKEKELLGNGTATDSLAQSLGEASSSCTDPSSQSENRLSLTIPGSFEE